MMVSAYSAAFGLPCITTRGNNVYGPRQFPEKLVPKFALLASRGCPLPVVRAIVRGLAGSIILQPQRTPDMFRSLRQSLLPSLPPFPLASTMASLLSVGRSARGGE